MSKSVTAPITVARTPLSNHYLGSLRFRIPLLSLLILVTICGCAKHQITVSPPAAIPSPTATGPDQITPYKVDGIWYQPLRNARNFKQTGLASWYGDDFHGKKTSSGELYDMYAMTAAHKELPINTYVKVINKTNNKSVVVRINDRGPFVRGRIIDLSYSAAKQLGIVGPGTSMVEITALSHIDDRACKSDHLAYQIAAFSDKQRAEELKRKLDHQYGSAYIVTAQKDNQTLYKVRVGKCNTLSQALAFKKKLTQLGITNAYLVTE